MHETVSFVATMYRDQDGSFESKKYTLILQVPERPGSTNTEKLLMFGSAPVDLGDYAVAVGDAPQPLRVEVPLKMRSGRSMLVTGAVQVRRLCSVFHVLYIIIVMLYTFRNIQEP